MSDAEIYAALTPRQKAIWDGKTEHSPEVRAAFIARWKGEPATPATRRAKGISDCVHLGCEHELGPVACPTCRGGSVKFKTYTCAVYGRCASRKLDGIAGHCSTKCPSYQAKEPKRHPSLALPVGFRHLVYHLLPVSGNGLWQWNVEQLRQRWHTFTGRKIIAVMTSEGEFSRGTNQGGAATKLTLDTPDAVRALLPKDAEIVELPNDPELREVVSWIPLWSRLATVDQRDLIFYAHAKGVTRTTEESKRWTEIMYASLLDFPGRLDPIASRHPIIGSFKRDGRHFGGPDNWHYSGSFFWVRAGDFYTRPWQKIRKKWFGNEAWPGEAYASKEAGVMFCADAGDLFSKAVWPALNERYAKWVAS